MPFRVSFCSVCIEVRGVITIQPWFLGNTDFYERISKEDLEAFRRVCPRQYHQKGSYIFRSGDSADELHLIEEGRVKLVSLTPAGGVRVLAFCKHGDFVGEAFLREKNRYSVDAVALTEVATCPMSRAQFLQLTEERAAFALTFAEILADQLNHCRSTLSDSYGSVKLRVAKLLLQQTQHFGKPLEETGWYELKTELTHDDIASMAAVTRVAVSKAFAELRRAGLVEGHRGNYRLNALGLESLVQA